ncbi:MAG TPA: HTH domain-containing protein [Phenylobacterium sp.]|uniref:HTH domain-containing protein n=1 Tax=Phenylobacterium sp. TaxID=1871053 RepID=UPI002B49EAA5|nr:HTH domain-containing protein [Phenylobacterium sp.]HKR86702.1 HTH domain-containing protein [Phenylobacterium sp.]
MTSSPSQVGHVGLRKACGTALLPSAWQQEPASMPRASRLFQVIQVLRRAPRPVTAAALAAALDVSKRAVSRGLRNEALHQASATSKPSLRSAVTAAS